MSDELVTLRDLLRDTERKCLKARQERDAALAALKAANQRLRRIVEHYDARSELYTSDETLAAGLVAIARAEQVSA